MYVLSRNTLRVHLFSHLNHSADNLRPELEGIYWVSQPSWPRAVLRPGKALTLNSTQLIQIVELFSDLLGNDLVTQIENSLEKAAVGAMRRNGTYPLDDNLTLGYSNPALMRALVVGWIGARRGNSTLIDYANEQGDLLLELFKTDGYNTLGEYNARKHNSSLFTVPRLSCRNVPGEIILGRS